MTEYIIKQKVIDRMGCCLASAKAEYKAAKDEFTKARFGDYISAIQAMIDVTGSVEAADVQPVDRDSLQIVHIGNKVYDAEKTIMSAIETMWTIRDAITHIEHAYSKHKELLSQISCCMKDGDVTPEIDYYINKIKEAANQIN